MEVTLSHHTDANGNVSFWEIHSCGGFVQECEDCGLDACDRCEHECEDE